MTKQKFDVLFILLLLIFLAIARPFLFDLTLLNIIYGFIPSLLMGFFWLVFPRNVFLNFFVTFIAFFIVIDMRPWLFQWSNHFVTAGIASLFALSFTLLYRHQEKANPLEGTFLNYFKKRFPTLSFFSLALIDTLISGTILFGLFFISIQKITFAHLIASLLISGYYSATAVYFHLYLPSINKK